MVLPSGGAVTNGSTANHTAVISAIDGRAVSTGGAAGGVGTIINFGTIETSGTGPVPLGPAIYLGGGGTITNYDLIKGAVPSTSGTQGVITTHHDYVTIRNFGTIAATNGNDAIHIDHGGRVVNGSASDTTALILGLSSGIVGGTNPSTHAAYGAGARGTVLNFGTVKTTGTGNAIGFSSGGSVINGARTATGALINSAGIDIDIAGGGGTVTNFGRILDSGTAHSAIVLAEGGKVTNGASGSSTALISSALRGVNVKADLATVANFGTIRVTSSGTSGAGVLLEGGGSVTNGAVGATAALITSTRRGVNAENVAATVTNYGAIHSLATAGTASQGIELSAGGVVRNGSATVRGAVVSAVYGSAIAIAGGAGTVVNFATIANTGALNAAVYLGAGGLLSNSGLIAGSAGAVALGATASAARVVNSGTLKGKIAVDVAVGNTAGNALVNAGLIDGAGGTAVAFGAGNDVLTVDPGAVFVGAVKGGGGANKVIEGAPGLLKVTGFTGFETIVLANGGADTLTLTNANFAGVSGSPPTITVDGGNDGNTVVASALTGTNRIVAVGGAGNDRFTGGAGNDFFYFSDANLAATDIVKGGGGTDTLAMTSAGIVHAGGVSGVEIYRLANGGPNSLSLTANNFIGISAPSVSPTSRPTITVFDGNDGNTVSAAAEPAGDQVVIHGGAGNDVFHAGGDTVMTGGLGTNQFWFSGIGSNTITDFGATGSTDEIVLSNTGFSLGLSGFGPLPAGLFIKDPTGAFTASTQRFAYDTTNGELFYSASGSTTSEHLVATLAGHPALAVTQLFHG